MDLKDKLYAELQKKEMPLLEHLDKRDPTTTPNSHVQELIWRKTPLRVLILQWHQETFQIIPPGEDQHCGSHAAGMYSKTWDCCGSM